MKYRIKETKYKSGRVVYSPQYFINRLWRWRGIEIGGDPSWLASDCGTKAEANQRIRDHFNGNHKQEKEVIHEINKLDLMP